MRFLRSYYLSSLIDVRGDRFSGIKPLIFTDVSCGKETEGVFQERRTSRLKPETEDPNYDPKQSVTRILFSNRFCVRTGSFLIIRKTILFDIFVYWKFLLSIHFIK